MATISIRKIRQAYKKADDKGKALLLEACGKEIFSSDVTDRVKSVRDACEELGLNYDQEFSEERTRLESPDDTGFREWKIIAEALNEGEEADFYNKNQKKWIPWVEFTDGPSGRGLAIFVVYCVLTYTYVAPRLYFLNEKHARYFFNQFPDTINKVFLNKKP